MIDNLINRTNLNLQSIMAIRPDGKAAFSFREVFSDPDGRTSSSSFIGFIIVALCMLFMTALTIFYFFNIGEAAVILQFIDAYTGVIGLGIGLMGVKSVTNIFTKDRKVSVGGNNMFKKKNKQNNKNSFYPSMNDSMDNTENNDEYNNFDEDENEMTNE